jgi:uncharacterized membrane protein YgcG
MPLPEELLYSEKQIESINAEFEKNKAQVARFKSNIGVVGTGGDSGGGDFSNGGGCDGGGDCG